MNTSRILIALVALGAGGASAFGADLGPSFTPPPAVEPMVEFGSGWYLRGDVGGGTETQAQISADIPPASRKSTWDVDVGAGYKFNEWFRMDLTFGLGKRQVSGRFGPNGNVTCPYTLQGVEDPGPPPIQFGYLWSDQAGNCTSHENAKLSHTDVLLNAYADLGTWFGITPYIGAGAGVTDLHSSGQLAYYKTSDGSLFNTDFTPAPGATFPLIWVDPFGNPISPQPVVPTTGQPVAFGKQDWSRSFSKTRLNFAWALMGGIAYNLTERATLDIGYRYINRGSFKSLPGQAAPGGVSRTLTTNEVRVGLRYLID